MADEINTEKIPRAKITGIGDALGVVFPKRNLEYSGLKKGDRVDVWYRKSDDIEEPEEK